MATTTHLQRHLLFLCVVALIGTTHAADCLNTDATIASQIQCDCGSATCTSGQYCLKETNSCGTNPVCPNRYGSRRNAPRCYCGTTLCAADRYCLQYPEEVWGNINMQPLATCAMDKLYVPDFQDLLGLITSDNCDTQMLVAVKTDVECKNAARLLSSSGLKPAISEAIVPIVKYILGTIDTRNTMFPKYCSIDRNTGASTLLLNNKDDGTMTLAGSADCSGVRPCICKIVS